MSAFNLSLQNTSTKFHDAKTKFLIFFVFSPNICEYSVGHLLTDPICFLSCHFLEFLPFTS